MQIIRRDGIAIRIPPDVTSAGGEATAAYVAGIPADCFPTIPAEYRAKGELLDAYVDELEQLGALAPFQARADARYAADLKAFHERVADAQKPAPANVDTAALEQARAAARRSVNPEPKATKPGKGAVADTSEG